MFGEGTKEQKNLLGGKGANLSEMKTLGVPVPAGFTITTEMCTEYYKNGGKNSKELLADLDTYTKRLEEETGKKFGSDTDPLLVSVRSGARVSMPGMMDTILNLGLTNKAVKGMVEKTGNPKFVYDIYRRFIQMFAEVVQGVEFDLFEDVLDHVKEKNNYKGDLDLTADDWKFVSEEFLKIVEKETGKPFPQDPKVQLEMAVNAVFESWDTPRARIYRDHNGIDHSWGTAVNVQQMVFGNTGDKSGTGVLFTRNPKTGEKHIFGEFLFNAQGEDIVAGIRTPLELDDFAEVEPTIYKELTDILDNLEDHYKEMQDVEFTIEDGTLFLLQTRTGKRTAAAAVKIAVDMVKEGLIDKEEAVRRIDVNAIDQLLHPVFNQDSLDAAEVLTTGLAASPGAASGKIVFSSEKAAQIKEETGEKLLLFRKETSPEDIEGMIVCEGFVTQLGGMTSHAAVVARGMGKCCVSGCGELSINEEAGYMTINGKKYPELTPFSIDGTTGNVYAGTIETKAPEFSEEFQTILEWAKEIKRLGVKANADNERDSLQALKFGAEGIGLCRTEHMFFDDERILDVRRMIIAEDKESREAALEKILPHQLKDFKEIFTAMEGKTVCIRLLDPPLHEFLPQEDEVDEVAKDLGIGAEKLHRALESLHEFNPMLGHRGCRLAVTYPEISVMQAKAIIMAAIEVAKQGKVVKPEIMVPLVSTIEELTYLKAFIKETADQLIADAGIELDYKVGTMVETPRAALTAAQIGAEAEFISYGTNDLTQMTFGFSRDDAGKFLKEYKEKGILPNDPFAAVDQTGVGRLVELATKEAKSANKDIIVGVCGEHGGEPSSIDFFHRAGLNYVSCSPFRIPVAIIAAAQAELNNRK
ncbi:pyruvate, phosphate dikinase [Candidatus Xianfuyuplasma coldseepsis]|uniref:Pyruvate, phosphate dikinase n=1 Tax=Candidatus Xianfuyuplasma coldseepsis TaxID=2782163 RepID=A0A7L7KT55_9MOLU|nr:pyruvate, phosphate dikinase [Xianfuyuplasma coldseepsis]